MTVATRQIGLAEPDELLHRRLARGAVAGGEQVEQQPASDGDTQPCLRGGTDITWRAAFRPRVPGTGWFWRLAIRRMLRQLVAGLAAARTDPAERR